MDPKGIKIVGKHIEITDTLAKYIKKQFSVIDKYMHKVISLQVILEKERYKYNCEVVLHTYKKVFSVKESDESVYVAIDKSFNTIRNMLSKYKRKIVSSKKHRKKLVKTVENVALNLIPDKKIEKS